MSVRTLFAGPVAVAAALVLGVSIAAAANTPVDDYWRDQGTVAAPAAATLVDDYFRDATVAPATVVDDYFRDVPVATAPTTIVDDYFRDAPVAAAPKTIVDDYFRDAPVAVVSTTGNGFDWADFGIGAAGACGALLLIAGLGLGIRAARLSGAEAKSGGMPV